MKKMYSAPIAEIIEAEMDDLMAAASMHIIGDGGDEDFPGYGEGKEGNNGGVNENPAKGSMIFDE